MACVRGEKRAAPLGMGMGRYRTRALASSRQQARECKSPEKGKPATQPHAPK
jgi:hypothetical protein